MNAIAAPGPLELLMMILLGGGGGLSSGLPPGPEDPQLANIAPAECLYFTSWAGTVLPEASSSNATEQLLAEPEVAAFLARVGMLQNLQPWLERAGAMGIFQVHPRAQPLLTEFGQLLQLIHGKPGALYVSQVSLRKRRPTEVSGGAMFRVGVDGGPIGQLLKKITSRLPTKSIRSVRIDDLPFSHIEFESSGMIMEWALVDGTLIVGLGDHSAAELLQRREAKPPTWLSAIRAKLEVPRVATISVLDLDAVMRLVDTADDSLRTRMILETIGFDQLQTLATVQGMDETGCVSRTLLMVDGRGDGLLELIDASPLTEDQLAIIPGDVVVAAACRLNLTQLFDTWLELMEQIDPRAADQMREVLIQGERELRYDFRDDILATVGDSWRIFAGPGPAELITGWTLAIELSDQSRFVEVHDTLVALASQGLQRAGGPTLDASTVGDETVYTLHLGQPGIPIAPSWCVTENDLLISLTAQPLIGLLNSLQDGSLSRATSMVARAEVAPLLKHQTLALAYVDTQHAVQNLLPWARMGLQAAVRAENLPFELNLSNLPPATAVLPHLKPTRVVLHRTADGVELEMHQTLPGANLAAAAPVAVALLLPAAQAAREAARRNQSMNNIKQLGLGLLNFESANGVLPAGYNADENGKPLLSWRVHILPYLEQQHLYDQFHLEEPWDSPHNKKLIEQMPEVFRSPSSTSLPGNTNYLGVSGADGVFVRPQSGNNVGTRFQEIRDGTSNTMMLVEVSDPAAVTWSKPGDFAPDQKKPTKGLSGMQTGGFLAGFTDGHVRFISENVDGAMLQGMFTKNGGEVINLR